MKRSISQIALVVLLITSSLFLSFSEIQENLQQKEEYALVYVEDRGKSKTISISKPGKEAEIITSKVAKKEDYTGVADVLARLNNEGYVLVSSSVAAMNGYLFYSYSLKKPV